MKGLEVTDLLHAPRPAQFQWVTAVYRCATGDGQPRYTLIRRRAEFQIWSRVPKLTIFSAALGLAAAAASQPHSVPAANRDELWFVVHDMCLPVYHSVGVAFPCLEINIDNGPDRGFAVLQAPLSATHVIVVPTARISGIESPNLESKDAP